jgi:hypothetical protein
MANNQDYLLKILRGELKIVPYPKPRTKSYKKKK